VNLARRRGFTVVELIVAALVGSLVAGATVTSVSRLLQVRRVSADRQAAFARADAAAAQIAIDLESVSRDASLKYAKVSITPGGGSDRHSDELLLLTTSLRPARGEDGSPEGQEYEVQFRLAPGEGGGPGSIWRRVDPGLDEYLDAGGVAAVIAPGAVSLSFEAYDGSDWFTDWNSDSDGMPHAVRVVVIGASDDGKTLATVRRVVAIDRVPLPPPATETTTGSSTSAATGTTSSSGGGR
jgi:prepilin-type N-terminal cleavage/methylation domain-containing protein